MSFSSSLETLPAEHVSPDSTRLAPWRDGRGRAGKWYTAGDMSEVDFESFFRSTEPSIRYALVAAFGAELGREAAADALAYAWEHWERVGHLDSPAGYIYRVGQRRARILRRRAKAIRRAETAHGAEYHYPDQPQLAFEPALDGALARLTVRQRQVILLIHGTGATVRGAARLLGISSSTAQTHLARGTKKLQRILGASQE